MHISIYVDRRVENSKHLFLYCPLYHGIRHVLLDFCRTNDVKLNLPNIFYVMEDGDDKVNMNFFSVIHTFIGLCERLNLIGIPMCAPCHFIIK